MKNISIYIDIAFCILLLPLMIIVFPIERRWGIYLIFFCIFVIWLYITYFSYRYYIIPRLLRGGRERAYALVAIAVSLLITFIFSSYEIKSPFNLLREEQLFSNSFLVWGVRQNKQAIWIHYIVVVFFCLAVGMLSEIYKQKLAREEIEYERNRAELALYKAQINPHFLFNTLNTLYGLLITRSDKIEPTMVRFINLTKYMYNNATKEYITIEEEVEYIGQYIELQRLRLNKYASVEFTHSISNYKVLLPPMLLITFVENAFKYGISAAKNCYIKIEMNQSAEEISFAVDNSICIKPSKRRDSNGVGLENCKKRLSLLYPGSHSLSYGEGADGAYHVRLVLKTLEQC